MQRERSLLPSFDRRMSRPCGGRQLCVDGSVASPRPPLGPRVGHLLPAGDHFQLVQLPERRSVNLTLVRGSRRRGPRRFRLFHSGYR